MLALRGDLDVVEAPRLDAAIDACSDGLPIVVDLSGLTFIDSSGLHVLLGERAAGRPAALVRGSQSNVSRVLEVVGVDRAVPIFADVAEAVERVGSG